MSSVITGECEKWADAAELYYWIKIWIQKEMCRYWNFNSFIPLTATYFVVHIKRVIVFFPCDWMYMWQAMVCACLHEIPPILKNFSLSFLTGRENDVFFLLDHGKLTCFSLYCYFKKNCWCEVQCFHLLRSSHILIMCFVFIYLWI